MVEKPSRRIAFCGASGTGKSDLAEAVAARFQLRVNPVGSRSVAASMGFASPYEVDEAGVRYEFQERLLSEKLRWEAEHEEFVTDRTPLDNLAYSLLHCSEAIDEAFLESCYIAMDRYTHVFHCPIESFQQVGEDPARRKGKVYHRLFQAVLRGLLGEWAARGEGGESGASEIWIHGSEPALRLREVMSWIET